MEVRKQKEIEYYDKQSGCHEGDFEGFAPILLESFRFLQDFLKDKCQGKKILDYGCGNGIHSVWLAQYGARVVGIDLSKNSLEVAKKRIRKQGLDNKVEFLLMDCENMNFPDNYFDIIFDGGTFSSLDIKKVFPELRRILKPGGFLIGIETFGHNPFTNFKRRINKLIGKRTKWAAEHIIKMNDLKEAERYFSKIEIHFFHPISWIAFPFLNMPGGKLLLKIFEKIDRLLLYIPFLKRFAFKVVFVLSQNEKII